MARKKPDRSCLVEVVRRDGPWVIVRIHGEDLKLSRTGADALGRALVALANLKEEPPRVQAP